MSARELPARAQVVVIGGGVVGTSIAYHLGHLGLADTLLLERDRLTAGTTWHAAGLMVTFGSTSETSTGLRRYTRDLYARLEQETGLATGFRPVGFIELAADDDRLEEYRRISAFNRHCGVEVHEISPGEVAEMFPLARTDDLRAGFYVPGDGRVNPVDVTMALGQGARQQGVTIAQGVTVLDVVVRDGAVRGVVTDRGTVECEHVVNAAGMWARQLGARSGVAVPLQAAEHYYLITEEMDGLGRDWPVIEDPARFGYYREEVGGLMIGLFETECAPWAVGGIPDGSSFVTLPPDWDRMAPYLEAAMGRIPRSFDTGVRTFFCGPESFTPDLRPIVGPAPEVRNYWIAAGMNSIGILTGGGIGRTVAQWIVDGDPGVDVTAMHPARLQPYQSTADYRRQRTVESLGMVYRCHYPNTPMRTARDAKRSPLHDRLAAEGAWFRDVSGWESPDWYAGPGAIADNGPLTWGRPSWWHRWDAEHRACRDGAVIMDMGFMAKFRVQGRAAADVLERLSTNRVAAQAGRITYTQWLNERALIEADVTVTMLDDDDFLVVATDTAHRRVHDLLRRACDGREAWVWDVTGAVAQINLQGPRSRQVLDLATSDDVTDGVLPYRGVRSIEIGFAQVQCNRITYVGELGYELLVPVEQAVHVYDRIVEAGASLGLRHAGLKALASLRMEKAYRDYGHDIDNTDDPLSVGFGWVVAWDKPGGFVGRERLEALRAAGPPRQRLVQVRLLDPEPLLVHAEVVHRNGVAVGYVRSASYGHTLGGAVGLAMVAGGDGPLDPEWLSSGSWTVDVAGREVPAEVSLRPMYDPTNARILG